MTDLLLSASINNRLLCEIATHDKFKELIADTEIFIDGVDTKLFNDLNSSLETVRADILQLTFLLFCFFLFLIFLA